MSFELIETNQGKALQFEDKDWHPIRVDFCSSQMAYRLRHIQGRNELIAKAIGWKKGLTFTVLDTTAGLGVESMIMALIGCQVTLLERNPIIFNLLNDGLERAQSDPFLQAALTRMQWLQTCAITYLATAPQFDVIYCDPMFETKENSALVKKNMQALQTVVGSDDDAELLAHSALMKAKKRLVVKRAINAPQLIANPSVVYKTKTHRFDVYTKAIAR